MLGIASMRRGRINSIACRTKSLFLLAIVLLFSLTGETKNGRVGRIKRIVILGNSIVRHGPAPGIGWNGDWGMAASVRDSDFVHLLIRDIHHKDPSVMVQFSNIADFERVFASYKLSKLDSLRNADLLIIKISENVNNQMALDSNFVYHYDRLIKYLAPEKRTVKIIVDGFWKKQDVNAMIRKYAEEHHFPFVTTTDLSDNPSNTAKGLFTHEGVAAHPSDKGMRMIAQRIWDSIEDYF
jgi:hypothetical protein